MTIIDTLSQDLADEKAHARSLVAALRHIALNCDHFGGGQGDSHIDEPTTGGVEFCGPCHAWRVLNGSPLALGNGRYDSPEASDGRT